LALDKTRRVDDPPVQGNQVRQQSDHKIGGIRVPRSKKSIAVGSKKPGKRVALEAATEEAESTWRGLLGNRRSRT
jgi:hypothetical protein